MNDSAPSYKKLLNLAWPIIISRSSQSVVGFTDAAMVSHLGEDSLAATTTGALNVLLVLIFPIGISFIVASFASQLHGKGDHEGARRYGYYGLAVALASQLIYFGLIAATPHLLSQLGYTGAVQDLMGQYIKVRLVTGGAAVGLEALGSYYGGLGNTRLPMFTQVLAMALNVVFCWVFIYGGLGVPALGVFGSALASALATLVAFLVLLGCFLTRYGQEKPHEDSTAKAPLRLSELARMLRFGIPSGLNLFVEFAAFTLFINVVLGGLGTTTLAGFMAAMQVNQIAFMPVFGLSSAAAILAGQAIGAQKHDDVPTTVRMSMIIGMAWQGLLGLIYFLFSREIMLPFAPPGEARELFLSVAGRLLGLSLTWQFFDCAGMVLAEVLRAAGDTKFTAWVRSVIAWVLFVPISYISVKMFGAGMSWVVAMLAGYLGLLAGILALRFRAGAWRKLDLTGAEMPMV